MALREYKDRALAAARTAGWTPEEVRSRTFDQIKSDAGAAGGFPWRSVKQFVAEARRQDQREAMQDAVRVAARQAARGVAGFESAVVTWTDEGLMRVRRGV